MVKRIGFVGLMVSAFAMAALWFAGSAGAIHELVVEYARIDGAPGEVVEIAHEEVEPFLQGESCAIRVEVANNASVHLGTDLVFTSGDDMVVIPNVETQAGTVFIGEGELILGETVTISVRLGPDGISSGGLLVDFDCDIEPPTTTTEPPATTEPPGPTVTTTEPPVSTTTTEPPPPSVLPGIELPPTQLPPTQPEPPTAAQPTFTG